MDAAVGNQLLQRDTGHLAANRIKRGNDDRFRGIVDDQINARRRLQRADVAALAANDAALHILVGQGYDGHSGLCDVIGSAALNRHGDDIARLLLSLVLRVLLNLANEHASIMERFLLNTLDDHVLRFVLRHLRHALKLSALLGFQLAGSLLGGFHRRLLLGVHLLRFLRQAIQLVLLALKGILARIKVIRLLVEGLLALGNAALAALHFVTAVTDFAVKLVLQANDFFLRLKDAFLLLLLSAALSVVQQVLRVLFRPADLLFLNVLAIDIAKCGAHGSADDKRSNDIKNRQPVSHSFFDKISFQFRFGVTPLPVKKCVGLTQLRYNYKQHERKRSMPVIAVHGIMRATKTVRHRPTARVWMYQTETSPLYAESAGHPCTRFHYSTF